MGSAEFEDPLGKPPMKTTMSLDDALEEFGYGKDEWPSIQDVTKRLDEKKIPIHPGFNFLVCMQIQGIAVEIPPGQMPIDNT